MFKILFISLIIYLGYKIIKTIFKGLFFINQIPRQNSSAEQNPKNPFNFSSSSREKDISDKVRILEEDKKLE